MDLQLNDIIAYMDCPRKYLHSQLNPDKAVLQKWLVKKREIVNLAVDNEYKPDVPSDYLPSVTASAMLLSDSIKVMSLTTKDFFVVWGKYNVLFRSWINKEGIPVHLHISSSPFRDYTNLYIKLMLLQQQRMVLYTQIEPRFRLKKSENVMEFKGRLMDGTVRNTEEVTITAQEIESNKHVLLRIMNHIKRGDFNTFNPSACCKVVETCPFYNVCWYGKTNILPIFEKESQML